MARQYVRLQAAQTKRESDEMDTKSDLMNFANRIGHGRFTM